jgi:hypothetical protein
VNSWPFAPCFVRSLLENLVSTIVWRWIIIAVQQAFGGAPRLIAAVSEHIYMERNNSPGILQ